MPSKQTLERLIKSCKEEKPITYGYKKAGTHAEVEEINGVHYWICPYLNPNITDEINCPFAERIKYTNKYKCKAKYKP